MSNKKCKLKKGHLPKKNFKESERLQAEVECSDSKNFLIFNPVPWIVKR